MLHVATAMTVKVCVKSYLHSHMKMQLQNLRSLLCFKYSHNHAG
jgi:hypothetical protein